MIAELHTSLVLTIGTHSEWVENILNMIPRLSHANNYFWIDDEGRFLDFSNPQKLLADAVFPVRVFQEVDEIKISYHSLSNN